MKSDPSKKKKAPKKNSGDKQKALLLGVGLDSQDGHVRMTSGPNFKLYGGSAETHEVMQETAVKVNEELKRRHKQLEEVGPSEFLDIVQKAKPQ